MRSASDVLHNFGGSFEYTCKNGKVLKVKHLDLKSMSAYEHKLQNRTIKSLTEQRPNIPSELYSEMFSEILDKISSGHYAFGGEICTKSLSTVQGIADLIAILCDISPEEAMDVMFAEGDSFKNLLDHVVRTSVGSKDDEETSIPGEKKVKGASLQSTCSVSIG